MHIAFLARNIFIKVLLLCMYIAYIGMYTVYLYICELFVYLGISFQKLEQDVSECPISERSLPFSGAAAYHSPFPLWHHECMPQF